MGTPAGWYDDGSGTQRWWDGQQWTDAQPDPRAVAGVPASTPQGYSPDPSAPGVADPTPTSKRVGVLAWIALGVTVAGAIVSWIPWIMGFGWILLLVGFVLSIVSLFLKGAKWPGIVGIALSVVAGIISGVIVFVIFLGYANTHADEFGGLAPTAASGDAATTETDAATPTTAERPSAQAVADGFLVIMDAAGASGRYTPEQALCIGQHLVDSDVSTDTLVNVVHGKDIQSDATERELVAQVTAEAVTACTAAQ